MSSHPPKGQLGWHLTRPRASRGLPSATSPPTSRSVCSEPGRPSPSHLRNWWLDRSSACRNCLRSGPPFSAAARLMPPCGRAGAGGSAEMSRGLCTPRSACSPCWRLDRHQHLAIRRAVQRTPGAPGEHAAAAVPGPGGPPGRPDAKEINFSQQGKHPLRISTEETEKLLAAHNRGEADQYVFLDVRENAEQAMGSLQGRDHRALP